MKQLLLVFAALLVGCGANLEDEFARQIEEQIKHERRCIDAGSERLAPSAKEEPTG